MKDLDPPILECLFCSHSSRELDAGALSEVSRFTKHLIEPLRYQGKSFATELREVGI